MDKDGAKLQIIWEITFEQRRGEAANNFGSLYLSKDGAKPQQEQNPKQCAATYVTSKDGAMPQ